MKLRCVKTGHKTEMIRPWSEGQLLRGSVFSQPVQRIRLFDLNILMVQTLLERAQEAMKGA